MYFIFIFLCVLISNSDQQVTDNPDIKEGDPLDFSFLYINPDRNGELQYLRREIQPETQIAIHLSDMPEEITFVLVQVHSYLDPVTISYTPSLIINSHVNGTDVGLVVKNRLKLNATKQTLYLTNYQKEHVANALVAVQSYSRKAPIPGGCNMEFPVKIAPYLNLHYTDHIVAVENQAPLEPDAAKCESLNNRHELQMYQMFLNENDLTSTSYFKSIENMMTVENIRQFGTKVPNPLIGSQMRHIFAAYPGTGSVYALIAQNRENDSFSSAYVPAFSYACDPRSPVEECTILPTILTKILCASLFFFGLVVCFSGHMLFPLEMFLIGTLIGGLSSYTAFLHNGSPTEYSILIAFACGVVWLLASICIPPVFSTLPVQLIIGALVASTIMQLSLGDWNFLESDLNFWSIYTCFVLLTTLLLTILGRTGNMLATAFLGGYTIILSVNHFHGSSLGYIVINTIRRMAFSSDGINNFRLAFLHPPYQYAEQNLMICWITLSLSGFIIQYFSNLNRPPFPSPGSMVRIILMPLHCCSCNNRRRSFGIVNVRTPLLRPGSDDVFYSPPATYTYTS